MLYLWGKVPYCIYFYLYLPMAPYQTTRTALVVDDHPLFRDSFSLLLERLDLFDVVRAVTGPKELTQFLLSHQTGSLFVFLDFYLGDHNSLPIINDIKRFNRDAKILMVSSISSPTLVAKIMSQGPHGFISKSSDIETIADGIRIIRQGDTFICPVIRELLDEAEVAATVEFTDRELEILHYFAQGLTVMQTAEAIHLSKHTVVSHRRNMMAKSNTNSITELLAYARKMDVME